MACHLCGKPRVLCETQNEIGPRMRYWSECPCLAAELDQRDASYRERCARDAGGLRQQVHTGIVEQLSEEPGFGNVGVKTFERFRPELLRSVQGAHPVAHALRWLERIVNLDRAEGEWSGPPQALYFYSPGPGRGKTHLALAVLQAAWEMKRAQSRRYAALNEEHFLDRYWNMPFGPERGECIAFPGERAWLTLFDDIGKKKATPGVQDVWYSLLNRRSQALRWTIFTSNYTPDELLERGTVNDWGRSRLLEMIRSELVMFDGEDRRLDDPRQALALEVFDDAN